MTKSYKTNFDGGAELCKDFGMTYANFDSIRETRYFRDNVRKETWVGRIVSQDGNASNEVQGQKEDIKKCFGLHYEAVEDEVDETVEGNEFKEHECEALLSIGCEMNRYITQQDLENEKKIKDKFNVVGKWRELKI